MNTSDLLRLIDARVGLGLLRFRSGGVGATPTLPSGMPPTGTAGGDLASTFPNPTVVGFYGRALYDSTPTNGEVYAWNASQGKWVINTISGIGGVTGSGTSGKITKWTGTSALGDATNTDADVASAVSLKHTQGTDTALGTLGTKNPPIDADLAIYRDSAAANVLVTSTWTQVKAFLKTYFDGLYAILAHGHSGTTDSPKLAQGVTHESADTDSATSALHHTIGATATTAAAGNHAHALTSDSLRLIWLGW